MIMFYLFAKCDMNINILCRDRTGSVTGPGPGPVQNWIGSVPVNFWTGADPLLEFLRCACIKADNVETVKP